MALRIDSSQNRNLYVGTGTEVAVNDGNAIVTGNVGIGTTNPITKLHVSGSTGAASGIRQSRTGVRIWKQEIDSSGRLIWGYLSSESGSTTQTFTLDDNGNVGIGMTSPTDKLTVNGNLSIFENKIYNGSASNSAGVSFPNSTTRIDGYNGITFHSSTTTVGSQSERMRITNAGNVGIGTTNPSSGKLVVEGDNYVITNSGKSLGGIDLRTNANPGAGLYTGGISFGGASTGRAAISGVQGTSADGDRQGLAFFTHGSGTGSADAAEAMRISTDGNVGIGTDSPDAKLEVDGSFNVINGNNGITHFNYQDGSTNYVRGVTYFDDSSVYFTGGNIGIGTTTATAAKLVVSSNTAPQLLIKCPSGGSSIAQILLEDNTGGTQNASITFDQSSQNTLTIATGYVSPTDENKIALTPGTTTAMTLRGGDDSTNTAGAIQFNGYVGTRQTGTPTYLLGTDASGNIVKTNTIPGSGTGPYLPLAGGRITGTAKIEFNNAAQYIHALSNNDLDIVAGDDINYRSNFSRFFSGTTEHCRVSGLANQNNWIANGSGGKLGVNITAPIDTLHVDGGVVIQNGNNLQWGALYSNGGPTIYGQTSYLAFTPTGVTGASSRIMLLNATGLGIGTTSPRVKLHVNGTNASVGTIGTPKNDWYTTAYNGIQIADGTTLWGRAGDSHFSGNYYVSTLGSGGGAQDTYINSLYAHDFWLDNSSGSLKYRNAVSGTAGNSVSFSTRFVVLNNGNFGIGTTTPSFKLDVQGTGGPRIRVKETTDNTLNALVEVENSSGNAGMLGVGGSNRTDILDNKGFVLAQTGLDGLVLLTEGSDPIIFATGGVATSNEKMRITNSGDVGIGTDSPNGKLTIVEVQAANKGDFDFQQIVYNGAWSQNVDGLAAIQWSDGIGSSNTIGRIGVTYTGSQGEFQIKDLYYGGYAGSGKVFAVRGDGRAYFTGNVGIGTTSPISKFTVTGTDNTNQANIGHSTQSVFIKVNGTNVDYNSSGNFGGSHTFSTGNTERIRITSAGTLLLRSGAFPTNQDAPFLYRIGGGSLAIGSATETGSGAHVALYTNSLERMRIDSSGNVGIGVTGPGNKLSVGGSVRVNDSGNGKMFFGTGNLNSIELDGTDIKISSGGLAAYYNNV